MNPQAQELISYDMSSKPEREANIFAAEVLLPDDEVIRLINDTEMNFFRAARELYVPPELMDFKFQILKNYKAQFLPQMPNTNLLTTL